LRLRWDVQGVAATAEIRPGAIRNRELTLIENALTRDDVASRGTKLLDVLAFRDRQAAEAGDALAELTRQAEDLGIYR
jgi:hypothetical protein